MAENGGELGQPIGGSPGKGAEVRGERTHLQGLSLWEVSEWRGEEVNKVPKKTYQILCPQHREAAECSCFGTRESQSEPVHSERHHSDGRPAL